MERIAEHCYINVTKGDHQVVAYQSGTTGHGRGPYNI